MLWIKLEWCIYILSFIGILYKRLIFAKVHISLKILYYSYSFMIYHNIFFFIIFLAKKKIWTDFCMWGDSAKILIIFSYLFNFIFTIKLQIDILPGSYRILYSWKELYVKIFIMLIFLNSYNLFKINFEFFKPKLVIL